MKPRRQQHTLNSPLRVPYVHVNVRFPMENSYFVAVIFCFRLRICMCVRSNLGSLSIRICARLTLIPSHQDSVTMLPLLVHEYLLGRNVTIRRFGAVSDAQKRPKILRGPIQVRHWSLEGKMASICVRI